MNLDRYDAAVRHYRLSASSCSSISVTRVRMMSRSSFMAESSVESGSVAASRQANVLFLVRGELLADPPSGSSALIVDVAGGNRRALRLLVGQSSAQSFAVGPNTQYLRWTHGVPTVVTQDNLAERRSAAGADPDADPLADDELAR